jgi:hypothetical protein
MAREQARAQEAAARDQQWAEANRSMEEWNRLHSLGGLWDTTKEAGHEAAQVPLMVGDLFLAAKFGVEYSLGGSPQVPQWLSDNGQRFYAARNGQEGGEALWAAEKQHLINSAFLLATDGAFRVGGMAFAADEAAPAGAGGEFGSAPTSITGQLLSTGGKTSRAGWEQLVRDLPADAPERIAFENLKENIQNHFSRVYGNRPWVADLAGNPALPRGAVSGYHTLADGSRIFWYDSSKLRVVDMYEESYHFIDIKGGRWPLQADPDLALSSDMALEIRAKSMLLQNSGEQLTPALRRELLNDIEQAARGTYGQRP